MVFWTARIFDLEDLLIAGFGGVVVGMMFLALRQVNVHVQGSPNQQGSGIGALAGWLLLVGVIGFAAYLLLPMIR